MSNIGASGFCGRLLSLKKPGETDGQFAGRIKVDRWTLGLWKAGKLYPKPQMIAALAKNLKVYRGWLAFGSYPKALKEQAGMATSDRASCWPDIYNGDIMMSDNDDFRVISRFDSFSKRIRLFQGADESDREFAARLGVKLRRLQNWKYRGVVPLMNTIRDLSETLSISPIFLSHGWGGKEKLLSCGDTMLVSISKGYFVWTEPLHAPENGNALVQ